MTHFVSLEEMKDMMPDDREYTDIEIEKTRDIMETFANFAYKNWIEKRHKKDTEFC